MHKIFKKYTRDQFIKWNNTIHFTKRDCSFIIALPSMIQTINIDKVSSGMKTKFVYFNWLEPPMTQTMPMKDETLQIFQDFPGCRKHSYIRQTTRGKYYFVKYVFKENNTICMLCEAVEALANRYGKDYQMTKKDF